MCTEGEQVFPLRAQFIQLEHYSIGTLVKSLIHSPPSPEPASREVRDHAPQGVSTSQWADPRALWDASWGETTFEVPPPPRRSAHSLPL